ncbi:hypothetical protein HS088_TW12G00343 [Tripterygium wilfordii]|uniref:Uncharacterized protein n=1 Tax=Tripterygium wilfordii TaxID=458696 RepID=A0A7J7CYI8_TRIWF|nr:uncharacterized protein LOC120011451 [Tripterygium wilfordii]KAF5739143.1 hypothetical protein HS088_TW12G00343 [Tripterygium wilfordii]
MQLRESMQKTKNFFHKTLQKFKSVFYGRYQKLPRSLSFNPLSCRSKKPKDRHTNGYYTDFCDEWECDLEKAERRKNIILVASKESKEEEGKCSGSVMELVQKNPLKNKQEEKNKRSSKLGKREYQCSQNTKGGVCVLAQKMKELEMSDVGDMEQVLDIEEALHYYSRLKSPVYVDMVNNFFTDMYSDFSVPQASASINNSKRRLGSVRF